MLPDTFSGRLDCNDVTTKTLLVLTRKPQENQQTLGMSNGTPAISLGSCQNENGWNNGPTLVSQTDGVAGENPNRQLSHANWGLVAFIPRAQTVGSVVIYQVYGGVQITKHTVLFII